MGQASILRASLTLKAQVFPIPYFPVKKMFFKLECLICSIQILFLPNNTAKLSESLCLCHGKCGDAVIYAMNGWGDSEGQKEMIGSEIECGCGLREILEIQECML